MMGARLSLVLALCLALAGAAQGRAFDCVVLARSVLKAAPVRPAVLEGARLALEVDGGQALLSTDAVRIQATVRPCAAGGTWADDCPRARDIMGDALSVYAPPETAPLPFYAIWHRKAPDGRDLAENVVLRCCTAGETC